MDGQIKDLLKAVKDDSITLTLENEQFIDLMIKAASRIISGPAAPLVGSIIGAAAPRINGVVINYRLNRFERNMTKLIEELTARVDSLESNYVALSAEMQEQYRGLYVEMLLDNVIDERQEEKIGWSINGFVSMMTDESNDNILQMFFDTLSELTVLDIDTLKIYSVYTDINWLDIEKKHRIDSDRLKIVKEKLVRFGLLTRRNDQIRDNNLDEIVDYLKKSDTDAKRRKPQGVKLPSSIKKIGGTETYRITSLGIGFLKCIGERC